MGSDKLDTRPQAPGQGRRRGHTRRGGGLHGQGHRADGPPRHRRGAARRRRARVATRWPPAASRWRIRTARGKRGCWPGRRARCAVGRCCTRRAAGGSWRSPCSGSPPTGPRVNCCTRRCCCRRARQLARLRPAWAGESVAAYRRSWLHGFAVRVHQRLVEAEARAAESADAARASPSATGPSVALVLADRSDAGRPGLRRGVPADRPGPASAALRVGLRGGRPRRARADLGGRRGGADGRRALDG